MTVKQLVARLETCDPEARILTYLIEHEDGGAPSEIIQYTDVQSATESQYFKSDGWDTYIRNVGPVVVIL